MTMLQNQARTALPNVLHDQGVPNTIGGIGLPGARRRSSARAGAVATGVAALLVLLAVLVRGAT